MKFQQAVECEKAETLPDLYHQSAEKAKPSSTRHVTRLVALLALSLTGLVWLPWQDYFQSSGSFSGPTLRSSCTNVAPIGPGEFLKRQQLLAETLFDLGASAYIAEPGPNAQFFGNLSASLWHKSERPLLLIVSPDVKYEPTGIPFVTPRITVLTPKFETTRAKLLPIAAQQINWIQWAEEADPYAIAAKAIPPLNKPSPTDERKGLIFVEDSIRHFIVDGFQRSSLGTKVVSAPVEVRLLRERKTPAEIEIMKCANEATIRAIRETRKQMYIGIRESEAGSIARKALADAGLSNGYCLVLFGENAALPHGSGTDRVLGKHDFALFDCGGTFQEYVSDVTRTFALDGSSISDQQLAIWNIVHKAQSEAHKVATNGTLTREVDETARALIKAEGYGEYFTHRLGHGIGLEGHEAPYLRGGSDDVIATGHTFSNEPGIYIESEIGVRLEDCFYVAEDGNPIFLTEGTGGQANSPWEP